METLLIVSGMFLGSGITLIFLWALALRARPGLKAKKSFDTPVGDYEAHLRRHFTGDPRKNPFTD